MPLRVTRYMELYLGANRTHQPSASSAKVAKTEGRGGKGRGPSGKGAYASALDHGSGSGSGEDTRPEVKVSSLLETIVRVLALRDWRSQQVASVGGGSIRCRLVTTPSSNGTFGRR